MPLTFKSTESDNRGTTSAPTIDKPGDLADGDFLLVVIAHDGTATVTTPPTGFTLAESNTGPGNDASVHMLYRYVADAAA